VLISIIIKITTFWSEKFVDLPEGISFGPFLRRNDEKLIGVIRGQKGS